MKILIAAMLATVLVGCAGIPKFRVAVVPDPVPESCDDRCRTPCDLGPGPEDVTIMKDDKDAFDKLVTEALIPSRTATKTCELHRQACVMCLDNLKRIKVTK